MDADPLETIYYEVKPEFDRAIARIGGQCADVHHAWHEQVRRVFGASADLEALSRMLPAECQPPPATFENFQERFRKIGEQLAEQRVSASAALMSLYLLMEAGLDLSDPERAAGVAARAAGRLYALAISAVAAGYEKAWHGERETLAKDLERAGRRQHQASAYVTNIYEQERRRLSHDLHDDIGHQLLLLKLYLELLSTDAKQGEIPQLSPRLDEALGLVSSAIDSIRRLILDLGPAIFDELGFLPAIRFYARQFSSRTAISVTVRASELPEDLPASHQVALYRVLQGALSNVVEHARAGRVKVSIDLVEGKKLIMVVEDNGVGFDPASVSGRSFGLTAMRERVEVLGGWLQIESTTAGSRSRKTGTRISVELPLPEGSAG